MKAPFSVLMSLYIKEKPEYFRECMDSILASTTLPGEIVIVKDGPLTDELERVLSDYVIRAPEMYNVVKLEENRGLGVALANGILHAKNELIARMDTDDIVRADRFDKQMREFLQDSTLDVCGSWVAEFEKSPSNIVAIRKTPLTDCEIKRYQKRRDAFNHMSVMYKKSAVLRAGNYKDAPLMEDTLLWVYMIRSGAKCKNLDECLVYARVGEEMFARRGGISYFKKYKEGRKMVRETGYIGFFDYYLSLFVQLVVALMPGRLRAWFFKNILHGKGSEK